MFLRAADRAGIHALSIPIRTAAPRAAATTIGDILKRTVSFEVRIKS